MLLPQQSQQKWEPEMENKQKKPQNFVIVLPWMWEGQQMLKVGLCISEVWHKK